MIELEHRPCQSDRVLAQQAEGHVILLNLDSGQYYTLDEIGSCVWELCDGTKRVTDIISLISQDYEAPIETIETDIKELVQDFVHEQLVAENSATLGTSKRS